MYNQVLNKLRESSKFRERRNKNFMIAEIVAKDYHPYGSRTTVDELTIYQLSDIIAQAATLDRMWRQVTQDHPELRGSDYNDKRKLSEGKQLELGYEPGHHARSKKLKQL